MARRSQTTGSLPPMPPWQRRTPTVLVLCIGIALSLIAYNSVDRWETRRLASRFEALADDRVAAVQEGIALNLEQIHSIRRFFAASRQVERAEFRGFVRQALDTHKAIQLLAWAPRVTAAQRAAHEREVAKDIDHAYQIADLDEHGLPTVAPQRPHHFPITYIEPYADHVRLFALDLVGLPSYTQAMAAARDSAAAAVAATGSPLTGALHGPYAFTIFLAIYQNDKPHATTAERRAHLHGYTIGLISVGKLVDAALEHLSMDSIDLHVYDLAAPHAKRFLYCRPATSRLPTAKPPSLPKGLPPPHHVTRLLHVADATWSVTCVPTPQFFAARRTWHARGVLVLGPLFTLLLAGYIHMLTGRTLRIERLVARRTDELSRANEDLAREVDRRKDAEERILALNADLERRVLDRTHELAATNEALAKAYQELRELDRLKSVFMAVVTHELRTPLMVMGGMLGLAENQLPPEQPKLQRMFQSARRASKRLETLTARILEVASKGDFGVELHTEPVAPADLVADVVADATPFAELRAQTLATDLAPALPPVAMERSKIRDVLLNLVMNAIKFTPDGGSITIAVAPRDHTVEFRVTDTGIGISEADAPHVFDEFFTTFDTMHHSTGDYEFQKRGVGVGLALVKRFVEMHGGAVGVESTEGQGSSFWFTLPIDGGPQGGPLDID